MVLVQSATSRGELALGAALPSGPQVMAAAEALRAGGVGAAVRAGFNPLVVAAAESVLEGEATGSGGGEGGAKVDLGTNQEGADAPAVDKTWLGASPDGLVDAVGGLLSSNGTLHAQSVAAAASGDDVGVRGVLEIKCPYKFRGSVPPRYPPYYYMTQAQGLMEILDRDWCDFFMWTPHGRCAACIAARCFPRELRRARALQQFARECVCSRD